MLQLLTWLPEWAGDTLWLLIIASLIMLAAWLWVLVWEHLA